MKMNSTTLTLPLAMFGCSSLLSSSRSFPLGSMRAHIIDLSCAAGRLRAHTCTHAHGLSVIASEASLMYELAGAILWYKVLISIIIDNDKLHNNYLHNYVKLCKNSYTTRST